MVQPLTSPPSSLLCRESQTVVLPAACSGVTHHRGDSTPAPRLLFLLPAFPTPSNSTPPLSSSSTGTMEWPSSLPQACWTAFLSSMYRLALATQALLPSGGSPESLLLPDCLQGTHLARFVSVSLSLDALMTSWSVVLVSTASIILWNLPYALLFFVHVPFFDRYLLQPKGRDKWTASYWFEALGLLAFNFGTSFVLQFLQASGMWLLVRPDFYAPQASLWTLPGPLTFLRDLGVALLVEDTIVYAVHRSLHHPWLYARFHKMHHEHKATFHLTSAYATAGDLLFSNLLPIVAGSLCTSHLAMALAFISLRLFLTTEMHSGYSFPWSLDNIFDSLGLPCFAGSRHHDRHHAKTHFNYSSTLYLWDWLLGTSEAAAATAAAARQAKGAALKGPGSAAAAGAGNGGSSRGGGQQQQEEDVLLLTRAA